MIAWDFDLEKIIAPILSQNSVLPASLEVFGCVLLVRRDPGKEPSTKLVYLVVRTHMCLYNLRKHSYLLQKVFDKRTLF